MFILFKKDIPLNAICVEVLDTGYNITLDDDTEGILFLLNNAKSEKHIKIEFDYRSSIAKGFQSGENSYSSKPEDMQDLVNAVTTGINQEFKSMDGVMRAFTPPQIKQVLTDITASKLNLVKWRDQQRAAIEAATTIEELELI